MMTPPLRPKLELLRPELVQSIVDEALVLLDRQGVFVENENALALFREAGQRVDGASQRVRISEKLVRDSLASTPSEVRLYDRGGDREFLVGRDEVHFDPGSTAITVLDPESGLHRKPVSPDLVRLARLTDLLPHYHFQSTGLVSSDVPGSIADSYRLFLALQFSAKPVVTGTFRVESFKPMLEMLTAVRGSAAALAAKPLAIFDACPSPPLKWSQLTSQSLIDAARAGLPSQLISMGMTGATSPATITGTLVQHTAENLCGLAICQLAKKGAPVIFGGSPSSFDMRKGTTPMGAIETMMIDMAYAQIGKTLGLPTHAYMGLTDAKVIDAQAGFEAALGVVLAALAGINVVSGPGMLNFESTQSLEKLAVDHEICGMAYRLIEGIAQRDSPMALPLFEALSASTQFLSLPHTRQWYRKEHTMPSLIDRDTYEDWLASGRKSMADRAAEDVRKRLAQTPLNLAGRPLRTELERIMLGEAKAAGLSRLPKAGD
jgi:trimethylamine--corrinoid protein Co-methyltransferase